MFIVLFFYSQYPGGCEYTVNGRGVCGVIRVDNRDNQPPAMVTPDEVPMRVAPASIIALSRAFEAPWLVVVDERGRYPAILREETAV